MSLALVETGSSSSSSRCYRPSSARTPRHGYKTVSARSEADELLFTSHNTLSKDSSFDPRWQPLASKERSPRPLIWAPATTTPRNRKPAEKTPRKNKYVPIKMSPSFVDETLFGPKLEEPSFTAPWKGKEKPFLFWSPNSNINSPIPSHAKLKPNSPKYIKCGTRQAPIRPVWKP